jgi:hypothetical protein
MIEHPDATFARYQGLDGENFFVKEGYRFYLINL